MKRKLTTILAADVVGYSRLMSVDEDGTHAQLKTHRKELIEPKTIEYNGRVVKLMGDGTLMEFSSVFDAVDFAVDVQRAMVTRNSSVPADRQINYRIGINVGDVIVEGDDLLGDGVNIASRLEGLAEPGGICVSTNVNNELEGKRNLAFEDLGQKTLKNIPTPIQVYRIKLGSPRPGDLAVPASTPVLPLPDKPSIAVLPFDNMSGDPEQEYFADGITEDVTTALSRSPWLFVIARNSAFTYKHQPIEVKRVASELGVRHVLEGSVRKAGNRVRVTAQLIDGITGEHVWAENYDGQLEDIFDLQDQITQNVVATLHTQIALTEGDRAERSRRSDTSVWNLTARGWKLLYELTKESFEQAKPILEKAIELEPNSCQAHWLHASILTHEVWMGLADDPDASIKSALNLATKAIELDYRNEYAHWTLGLIYLIRGQHDQAIAELTRAIEINPNCSLAHGTLGTALSLAGQSDESIRENEIAIRSNPRDISIHFRYSGIALAHFVAGRYDDALHWARKSVLHKPNWRMGHAILSASYVELDQFDEAQSAVRDFRAAIPNVTASSLSNLPFKYATDRDKFLGALRKAGLPE